RISPQEIDLHTRAGEPLDKLVLIHAMDLLRDLPFAHWRELQVDPLLSQRVLRQLPTMTVREERAGLVAVANLIARMDRSAALRDIEKQIGSPLGDGTLQSIS